MTARHTPFDEWLSLALFVIGEMGGTLVTIWTFWPIKVNL